MPDRALVWFRRDLRVHDNPALTLAHRAHDEIVPVFVLDRRLIEGEYPSGPRTAFLLASLEELREALRVPADLDAGTIPGLDHFGLEPELTDPIPAGERAARERASRFLARDLETYADRHDRLAGGTSELSPAIHFGCISVRELEQRASEKGGEGADAFTRQLAWRDFYAHVLLHNPANAHAPFQRRMEALETREDHEAFDAWREGRTGVPIVDAAMRQLKARGWMHNRARLVVGSFLTKNLHVDYRLGEAHFMRYLLCGDKAQNNGNWQWIASVGVDPAPAFQRMFNPVLQHQRFDPKGEYVRRWVPELAGVDDKHLPEPWTMTEIDQEIAGCVIGRDYPAPIVDHKREREVALQRYRDVPRA